MFDNETPNSDAANFDALFPGGCRAGREAYRMAIEAARQQVEEHLFGLDLPYRGATPAQLAAEMERWEVCPELGSGLEPALAEAGERILAGSVNVWHPACAAHLHCPPLVATLAAEVMISAANQSMDSWDQSPAATFAEQRLVRWLAGLFGYGPAAGGTFTSGGTQSNLMGLLLARNRYARENFGWDVQRSGLPPEAGRMRILCSEAAHFTVIQSAAVLGLGERAVVTVPTDEEFRLDPQALDRRLEELRGENLLPVALVGTVGTTDFGSIDPLPELARRAREHGMWLHVDAAYGGALALSDRYRRKLAGIEEADSITVDFHKLFYQPISCGAFLLRESDGLEMIRQHAEYLNPEEDDHSGVPNLVTSSLQTTRRFDALKLLITLRALGRRELAGMVESTVELANRVAEEVSSNPDLEMLNRPEINSIVLRYRPRCKGPAPLCDEINDHIRERLLSGGEAVVARTRIRERLYLKLTLLNPRSTLEEIARVATRMAELGRELEAHYE